ncbi:YdcF family protein [uncultured Lamprocystis sp.]|nr:YdcF family protein [uncultured Lamprocystis sp.]
MDWLDLQRLITDLLKPLTLGLGLMLLGLAWRGGARWRRLGSVLLGSGLAILLLASSPWVADRLIATLERGYPPRSPSDCHPAAAIVVLGGAMQPWVQGDRRPRVQQGADRVWEAARLYHAGCAPVVVVSAGGPVEPPFQAGEAAAIASLLEDLGVSRSALLLDTDSRNTQSNAAVSRSLLAPLGADRILLVTSAWHLRRQGYRINVLADTVG